MGFAPVAVGDGRGNGCGKVLDAFVAGIEIRHVMGRGDQCPPSRRPSDIDKVFSSLTILSAKGLARTRAENLMYLRTTPIMQT